jgi:5-methylcytosine-specific restriction endonuclease McrA
MTPKYSHARRQVYKRGEVINRLEVFERDLWVCWLCDTLVDRTLRLPDPMAATLDHVVPIGEGGDHTYENVALAHADCNFKRGCNSALTNEAI